MTCLSNARGHFISRKINDAIKNLEIIHLTNDRSIFNRDDENANLPTIYSHSCNINSLTKILDQSSLAVHLLKEISKNNSYKNIDLCSIFTYRIMQIIPNNYEYMHLGLLYFANKIQLIQKEQFSHYISENIQKSFDFLFNYGQLYQTFIKLGQDINAVLPFFIKNADALLLRICIEAQSMYLFSLKNNYAFSQLTEQVRKELILNTFFVCTELAKLFGVEDLSDAIEDFGFCIIEPKAAKKIKTLLKNSFKPYGPIFDEILSSLKHILTFNNIGDFYILFRVKRAHSIWIKTLLKAGQIQDIVGFRIIVTKIKNCYVVLNLLKAKYSSSLYKVKDFICSPKNNGYKAIHVILHLKELHNIDSFVEIQIKTSDMEIEASIGKASHTLYKYKKLLFSAF